MSVVSSDPAITVIVVGTGNDAAPLAKACRAIRAQVAGNIQVTTTLGDTVICQFLAGETRAIAATKIWATNTTATGIEAMI